MANYSAALILLHWLAINCEQTVSINVLENIPLGRNRDCVPEPVFFSPPPISDYTVSAIKIVQFCM